MVHSLDHWVYTEKRKRHLQNNGKYNIIKSQHWLQPCQPKVNAKENHELVYPLGSIIPNMGQSKLGSHFPFRFVQYPANLAMFVNFQTVQECEMMNMFKLIFLSLVIFIFLLFQLHQHTFPYRKNKRKTKITWDKKLTSINIWISLIGIACENIRFSSLFAARDTSPSTKSEEKRMFSQAIIGTAEWRSKCKQNIAVIKDATLLKESPKKLNSHLLPLSIFPLCLMKHWYHKEIFDTDHSTYSSSHLHYFEGNP